MFPPFPLYFDVVGSRTLYAYFISFTFLILISLGVYLLDYDYTVSSVYASPRAINKPVVSLVSTRDSGYLVFFSCGLPGAVFLVDSSFFSYFRFQIQSAVFFFEYLLGLALLSFLCSFPFGSAPSFLTTSWYIKGFFFLSLGFIPYWTS